MVVVVVVVISSSVLHRTISNSYVPNQTAVSPTVECYQDAQPLVGKSNKFYVIQGDQLPGNLDKNSSGDKIANVNFYAVRLEATRIP